MSEISCLGIVRKNTFTTRLLAIFIYMCGFCAFIVMFFAIGYGVVKTVSQKAVITSPVEVIACISTGGLVFLCSWICLYLIISPIYTCIQYRSHGELTCLSPWVCCIYCALDKNARDELTVLVNDDDVQNIQDIT